MSRVISRSTVLASVVGCLALAATTATAFVAVGWHGLSQSERDSRILSRARSYSSGTYTGMSCKEWVRRVVRDASGNVVTIPATSSNDYQWESSADVYGYAATQCPPRGIDSGRIIQMIWTNQSNGRTNPHTAIITSITSTGMNWIDCNWNGDQRVQRHFVSFSDFNTRVRNNYTVYKIR